MTTSLSTVISIFVGATTLAASDSTSSPMKCYPQGPCKEEYMDQTDGNFGQWAYCSDCAGGGYYTNIDCECACIPSNGCDTTTEGTDRGLSSGAIEAIAIGAAIVFCCLCAACLCILNFRHTFSAFEAFRSPIWSTRTSQTTEPRTSD